MDRVNSNRHGWRCLPRRLVAGFLAGRIREIYQIGLGFGLMGTGLALLVMARSKVLIFALVGLLALGMALISPNLAALVSKGGGSRRVGAALGFQNAANSLGQAGGPLVGSALFIWQVDAPLLLTGVLLITVALIIGGTRCLGDARPDALDEGGDHASRT